MAPRLRTYFGVVGFRCLGNDFDRIKHLLFYVTRIAGLRHDMTAKVIASRLAWIKSMKLTPDQTVEYEKEVAKEIRRNTHIFDTITVKSTLGVDENKTWDPEDPPNTDRDKSETAYVGFCAASGGAWDSHEKWRVRWDSWLLFERDLRVPTVGFRVVRKLHAGEKGPIRDCSNCPEMEIIPAGVVQVTWPPSREQKPCEKGPPTAVSDKQIERMAIGKYEVTINEWNACGAGCERDGPTDYEESDGNRPVVNVSWKDAQKYVEWLNKKTNETYRLPYLREWQYAAKGNKESCRYWGDEMGRGNANCSACGLTWVELFDAAGLPLWRLDDP